MRTIIKELKVYKYEELSNEAKKEVKDFYLSLMDAEDFSSNCKEYLKETYGIENLEVGFSLRYSQGDGVCMYGDIQTYNDNFFEIITKRLSNEEKELFKKYFLEFKLEKRNNRYSHSRTVSIEIEKEEYENKEIETIFDIVAENVEQWYFKECKEMEENGYKFFYEIADEELKEYCEANDYEFTEDGKLFQ